MLIDAHVHLFPDRLVAAIRRWFDSNMWETEYRLSSDECVAKLLAGGVDRAVALPYAHKPGMAAALNAFTAELAARHPMVVPCCTVFPGEEGEERLLEEALSGPFCGVKIHSHVMKIAPDDPRLDPVFRASARHRKPVVIHCGREPAHPAYGLDVHTVSGAARLRRALERHPEARVIVPHLGIDETFLFEELLEEFEHLYLDTTMALSGYFPVRPDLEILRRKPERILYGTDFPNLPYDWTTELGIIRGLGLPARDQALILGGNAQRLFGIQ